MLIMHRILCAGIILLISPPALPGIHSLSSKNHLNDPPKEAGEPSLFTQSELEEIFPDQPVMPRSDDPAPASSPASVPENRVAMRSLNLPISDESSDDFNLEILSGNTLGRKKEFDIPIVINEKVEHFLHYFQTTARNSFSNWLARAS